MRKLIIGIAVLAVLLVLADRGAAELAEREIEQRAQQRVGSEVHAEILGVPFLTQALRRELDHVVLTADTAQLSERDVDVRNARLDLREVDIRSTDRALIDRVSARALVPWEELERQVERSPLPRVSLSATPDGAVRVARTVDLQGRSVQASARAEVRLDGRVLVVEPLRVSVEDASLELDEQVSAELAQLLRVQVPADALPRGIRLDGIDVREEGILVRLTGSEVPVGQ